MIFSGRNAIPNGWGTDPQQLPPDEELKPEPWPKPDISVLKLHRRSPPALPLDVFGPWRDWIAETGEAAACPVDDVAMPLLASTSVLIGNARWAVSGPGWGEPPHLWVGSVGDSGDGKSPGADCLMRDVLPEIERRMQADFPDRLREWRSVSERQQAAEEIWKHDVRDAEKNKRAPPLPPTTRSRPSRSRHVCGSMTSPSRRSRSCSPWRRPRACSSCATS
jgi:hypothetical protein